MREVSVMEDDGTSSRSSLARLKALDSLPDLPAQLAEANRLCKLPSRAEMVVKWLLGKLKSDQDTSFDRDVWTTLLQSLRMLSPECTAGLIKSQNLLEVIQLGLKEPRDVGGLLFNATEILEFLFDVSNGPNGSPIKPLLTFPAKSAATFLGSWLQSCLKLFFSRKRSSSATQDLEFYDRMLQPGLQIWDRRKSSVNENDLFSEFCLLPAAQMLACGRLTHVMPPTKRKMNDTGSDSDWHCKQNLERLIANHIFRPARTAFYRVHDTTLGQNGGQRETLHPQERIKSLLKPVEGKDEGRQFRIQYFLPALLDIAMRSVSFVTPRQRVKEMPWIETAFEALCACNIKSDGNVISLRTLVHFLSIVRQYCTLSNATLRAIVQNHCNLDRSKNGTVPWHLVAEIATTNADIFTEKQLAESLLGSITEDALAYGENPSGDIHDGFGGKYHSGTGPARGVLQSLWLDSVVAKVVYAFAKQRDLVTFIELWRAQLQVDQHNKYWSVWTELDEEMLAPAFEHVIGGQRVSIIDSIVLRIEELVSTTNGETTSQLQEQLNADIVILNVLLRGAISETLQGATNSRLDRVLDTLLSLDDQSIAPNQEPGLTLVKEWRSWALISRVLEIWYPQWQIEHNDPAMGNGKIAELLKRPAVCNAMVILKGHSPFPKGPIPPDLAIRDAGCFAATLYSLAAAQDPIVENTVVDAVIELFTASAPINLELIARYPGLLKILDIKSRRKVFCTAFDALRIESTTQNVKHQALQSLAEIAAQGSDGLIEDLVETALDRLQLESTDDHKYSASEQESVVRLFCALPATHLSRAVRERIINSLCQMRMPQHPPEKRDTFYNLRIYQLATLTRMMEVSNPTCTLSTDPSAIWRLAQDTLTLDGPAPGDGLEDARLKMLAELLRLTLDHLLSTQEQERSRKILVEFSTSTESCMKAILSEEDEDQKPWRLALVQVVIHQLETRARGGLGSHFVYRTALHSLVERLRAQVVDGLRVNSVEKFALDHTRWHSAAARFLLAMPQYAGDNLLAMDDYPVDRSKHPTLARHEGESSPIPTEDSDAQPGTASMLISFLVDRFGLVCKFGTSRGDAAFSKLASTVVDYELSPTQLETVKEECTSFLDRLDGKQQLELLEETINRAAVGHGGELELAKTALSKLDQPSNEADWERLRVLYISLLGIFAEPRNIFKSQAAAHCALTILRHKPFVMNQHLIEATLATVYIFLHDRNFIAVLFRQACDIISALFLQYRARLRGRYHHVVATFQAILARLFTAEVRNDDDDREEDEDPRIKCGQRLSRLLTLFCDPPQTYRQPNENSLVDEGRKEQAYVGQHVRYVLHYYCTRVLSSTPAEGLRDALTQGLWSMIEAIEINNADGIKSLSSAMTNSEREILRSIYEDWKRFGKWRGG